MQRTVYCSSSKCNKVTQMPMESHILPYRWTLRTPKGGNRLSTLYACSKKCQIQIDKEN